MSLITGGAGSSTTDQNDYTTASVTPTAGKLYVLTVAYSSRAGATVRPSISGLGLAWELLAEQRDYTGTGTVYRGVSTFVAKGTPTAGPVTITFSTGQTGCGWILSEHDADLSAAAAAAAVLQPTAERASGDAGATGISNDLPLAAKSNVDNVVYAAHSHTQDEPVTPGAGFSELADVNWPSDGTSLQAQTSATSVLPAWSWTSDVRYAAVAFEIKAPSTPPPPAPSGSGRWMVVGGVKVPVTLQVRMPS